jgi:glycosyltransferase involved in cell wall biosynthesis
MNTQITIILPINNESRYILSALDSILAQDYPPEEVEILVADGMSTDGTREIVQEYIQKDPRIRMIDNPGKIVPTGMNLALRQARGDIIIRVDGHTQIAPDYVKNCVELLEAYGAENVGGRMVAVGQTAFARAVAAATSTPFGVGGSRFHYSEKEEEVDSVYMGAWPKSVFYTIGLFDEELVRDQDDEFNYRLRKHGGRIILSPRIKSEYTVRSTPAALWKQYFQYGFWKVRVFQKHPGQMSLRHFIPAAFVTSLIGSMLLTLLYSWGWLVLAATAGSYLVANFAASFLAARKKGWSNLPLLPVAFAIIHLSYGIGFLAGLFKFANRWGDKNGKVPNMVSADA